MATIYIIEDDEALRRELAHILELSGFTAIICQNLDCATQDALAAAPDCVVLDLKLPTTDGHSICRDIRAQSNVPIIMLTSSDSEFDEIMSMNLGADDYITKPYNPAVLMARINSLLRRSATAAQHAQETTLSHNGVTLNLATATVHFDQASAELTRNELKILQMLMRNPGVVVSRADIMCELWESDAFVDDNTLTVNVNRLRKTLAGLGVSNDYLTTRRGQGYSV